MTDHPARTEIERHSVDAQTALIADGLSSDVAREFLENMPAVEALMPPLDAPEIKQLLDSSGSA